MEWLTWSGLVIDATLEYTRSDLGNDYRARLSAQLPRITSLVGAGIDDAFVDTVLISIGSLEIMCFCFNNSLMYSRGTMSLLRAGGFIIKQSHHHRKFRRGENDTVDFRKAKPITMIIIPR